MLINIATDTTLILSNIRGMNQTGLFTKKLNIKQNQLLTRLFLDHYWLLDRDQAIYELMDKCNSLDEQTLILELFHRFTYIDDIEYSEFCDGVAIKIIDDWQLLENQAGIVATSYDGDPDSSQVIIHAIRTTLTERTWFTGKKGVFVNTTRRLKDLAIQDGITIILVDEFVGSGQTMINTIADIKKRLEDVFNVKDYSIKVCVLASIEQGKQRIEESGVEVYVYRTLKKGISGNYRDTELETACSHMLRLESFLMNQINTTSLPSFGYRRAEALYARQEGTKIANTPNSVFPIFWWPKYSDGSNRRTVLHRAIW